MDRRKVEAPVDQWGEVAKRTLPRDRDEVVATEVRAGLGERGLLHVGPEMGLRLVGVVEENAVAAAGHQLLAPRRERDAQLRHPPGT